MVWQDAAAGGAARKDGGDLVWRCRANGSRPTDGSDQAWCYDGGITTGGERQILAFFEEGRVWGLRLVAAAPLPGSPQGMRGGTRRRRT
ncbi:hypothetical protein E2562_018664 [Oryza meyeriana var. granulata]|uniref:Uncharacterized protein n=1 Tax=Oryza meyeriana var. granulata TaxID=110450 RepID=A0A6G1BYB9_9ORYZ|nr:hypothetical protein E2562_018664 [Oryza meyeriana var. granulata]